MSQDKTSRNAIIYTVGNFCSQAISAITAPIFTQLLSPNDYGETVIYSTWISILIIFVTLELHGSLTNAYFEFGGEKLKAYIKNCITIALFITIVMLLGAKIFAHEVVLLTGMKLHYVLLALMNCLINSVFMYCTEYLAILRKALLYVVLSLLQLVMNLVFSIVFIMFTPMTGAAGRIYGGFLSSFLIGIVLFAFFYLNKEKIFNPAFCVFGIKFSLPLVFHALSGLLLTSCDKLMLGRIKGNIETGIYGFAVTMISILDTIARSFNTAWRLYLYDSLSEGIDDAFRKRLCSYIRCYAVIVSGFVLVVREVVMFLVKEQYWECIDITIVLALGSFLHFLYYIPVNNEFYHKYNFWIPVASTITGAANIGFNYFLIPRYGMIGAALATVISYLALLVAHDCISRYLIGNDYLKVWVYVKYSFFVFGMILLANVAEKFWPIRWGVASVLGMFLLIQLKRNKQLF